MITRPLDLASRLRGGARSFDWLFFVNAGLLGLFFALFGSPFVLAPGMALKLPEVAGAEAAAVAPTSYLRVTDSGQIFVQDGGGRSLEQLPEWLRVEAKRFARPTLMIMASDEVRVTLLTEIATRAKQAGFGEIMTAATEPKSSQPNAKRE